MVLLAWHVTCPTKLVRRLWRSRKCTSRLRAFQSGARAGRGACLWQATWDLLFAALLCKPCCSSTVLELVLLGCIPGRQQACIPSPSIRFVASLWSSLAQLSHSICLGEQYADQPCTWLSRCVRTCNKRQRLTGFLRTSTRPPVLSTCPCIIHIYLPVHRTHHIMALKCEQWCLRRPARLHLDSSLFGLHRFAFVSIWVTIRRCFQSEEGVLVPSELCHCAGCTPRRLPNHVRPRLLVLRLSPCPERCRHRCMAARWPG